MQKLDNCRAVNKLDRGLDRRESSAGEASSQYHGQQIYNVHFHDPDVHLCKVSVLTRCRCSGLPCPCWRICNSVTLSWGSDPCRTSAFHRKLNHTESLWRFA
jgi:hypothetical protein